MGAPFMPATFSIIGLALNLIGVIVLFRYGMPYRARSPRRAERLDAMAPAKISLKVSQRSVDNPSARKNLCRRSDTLDHELREYTR
jgi:hypothetical protein